MPIISSTNTIAETFGPLRHAGVPDATTQVGAAKGALLVNTLTGIQYTNVGTGITPSWTVVGAQV